jgi:signal transduction histidine kinase
VAAENHRLLEAERTSAELRGELIAAQKRLAEQRAHLGDLVGQREDERRDVATRLHEECAQSLAAVLLGIGAFERAGAPGAIVEPVREQVTQTLVELRELAVRLRPPALDQLGLGPALERLAERVPRAVRLRSAELGRLPPDVETAVFRIVQEGITNAVKHARAGRVWVGLHRDEGGLTVRVADDGVGLPPFEAANGDRGGRLGLFGMAERAKLLGGEIEIGPRPGGGTLLELRLPLAGVAVGKVSGERSPHPGPPQAGEGAVRLA